LSFSLRLLLLRKLVVFKDFLFLRFDFVGLKWGRA